MIANRKYKKVYQFDLDGNFLQEYYSITFASKVLGVSLNSIKNSSRNKHLVNKKFYFSYYSEIDLYNMCLKNNSKHSEISNRFDYNKKYRKKEFKRGSLNLGYKDESYFTESEMMLGYVSPSYEDLSKDEKEIWNELEKEKVV